MYASKMVSYFFAVLGRLMLSIFIPATAYGRNLSCSINAVYKSALVASFSLNIDRVAAWNMKFPKKSSIGKEPEWGVVSINFAKYNCTKTTPHYLFTLEYLIQK